LTSAALNRFNADRHLTGNWKFQKKKQKKNMIDITLADTEFENEYPDTPVKNKRILAAAVNA
jgi:hypothetical protein